MLSHDRDVFLFSLSRFCPLACKVNIDSLRWHYCGVEISADCVNLTTVQQDATVQVIRLIERGYDLASAFVVVVQV